MASITSGQEFTDERGRLVPIGEREQHVAEFFDVPAARLGLGAAFYADKVQPAKAHKLKSEAPPVPAQHAELTKLAYMREALYRGLFPVTKGVGNQTITAVREKGVWKLRLGIDTDQRIVPWAGLPPSGVGDVTLMGTDNGKMRCPSFDLPAGSPSTLRGTCPGSLPGQSASIREEPEVRGGQLIVLTKGVPHRLPAALDGTPGAEINLRESICQSCYATGGNFAQYASIQRGAIVRFVWTNAMLDNPETALVWHNVMVDALLRTEIDDCERQQLVRPIRIHSAGDFFSRRYAAAWIKVINEVVREDTAKRAADEAEKPGSSTPPITFWAPTRTWASSPQWIEFWRAVFSKEGWTHDRDRGHGSEAFSSEVIRVEDHARFIVRPSAYHFGDAAPAPGAYGSPAAGTTAAWDADTASRKTKADPMGAAGRWDWTCKAYETKSTATCANAPAPDANGRQLMDPQTGRPVLGCRACWQHPELRIAYAGH
jgi:hypothetical protein